MFVETRDLLLVMANSSDTHAEKNGRWYLINSAQSHLVEVCQSDVCQVEGITDYLLDGLHSGEAVIVFASSTLRKNLASKMKAANEEFEILKGHGRIKFFDLELLLSNILINGIFIEKSFQDYIGVAIGRLQSKFGKVRVFGGMTALLWKKAQYDLAVQVEKFWINLAKKQNFLLLSSYLLCKNDPFALEQSLQFIQSSYQSVAPAERYYLRKVEAKGFYGSLQ